MDSAGNEQEDVRKGVEDSDMLGDTLNAFLTSSLNVELVYTILKGIRRIVRTPDLETWKNGQVPENDTNDFSMRLTLDNIKIRNFKLWENAHQQQFLNDPNMPFETKVERELEAEIDKGGEELTINKRVDIEGHYIHLFKDLRSGDGISTETLLASLDPESNSTSVFKAGEASGASGSFFFFSADKRFIVKTMTTGEKEFFVTKVARPYFAHLKKNRSSLLARIYGVYTVKIQGCCAVHLMLMAHTMQIESPNLVQRVFDLKGSTVDRKVKMTKGTSK